MATLRSRIYLDYASLTPIDSRVLKAVKEYSSKKYANPSSLYKEGVAAKNAVNEGRTQVAEFIHAHSDEIIFTSGGTEANGLALEGAGRAARRSGIERPHLIISAIEHSSIIEIANMMEKHGVTVTRLGVNKEGLISLDELRKAITSSTYMVSIMAVNNEIGTVQPIREIAKIIRQSRQPDSKYPLFHVDAAQGHYGELAVEKLGIELMTLDSGKVYGPRGIGALYIRRNTPIEQVIYGGGQESGLRSGTENIPAIMGFAKALQLIGGEKEKEVTRLADLKNFFTQELIKLNKGIAVNGSVSHSSPHILNVSIPGIDSEFFILQLDAKGVSCSTKSSCLRDEDESYVLKAIGADSKTSVRFSLGRFTTKGELKKVIGLISKTLTARKA